MNKIVFIGIISVLALFSCEKQIDFSRDFGDRNEQLHDDDGCFFNKALANDNGDTDNQSSATDTPDDEDTGNTGIVDPNNDDDENTETINTTEEN